MGLSRELKLIAEYCLAAFSGSRSAAVPSDQVYWTRFLRLARFHRVQGLVWSEAAKQDVSVPNDIAEALAVDAGRIAASNLRAADECKALLADFERHRLPSIFIKGLTLAQLAYGTIATKAAVDIDLLTDTRSLNEAAGILRSRGYRLAEPNTVERLRRWHDLRKESTWVRDDAPLQVDLHTRLADHPSMIPAIGLGSELQDVEVAPGIVLPTLAGDELVAYLAVHGSSSAWFRLKWITDFAALIHGRGPGELTRLYDRSQALGAGRAAAQALLLANSLYGSLSSASDLKLRLERDRGARWLHRIALRQLTSLDEPAEPTERPLGTAAIHYSQLLLRPGVAFKVSELTRQVQATFA